MTVQIEEPREQHQRVPPWRNVTFLKWAAQIVFLAGFLGVFWILGSQAGDNLASRGLDVSFDFLDKPPGIALAEGIDVRPATGWRALFVGVVNMLRITVAGIFGATILGIIIGVSRLSNNWIVTKVAGAYVETVRNIPLLVQIIAWGVIITTVPGDLQLDTGPLGCAAAESGCEGWFFLSNKGVSFAWVFPADGLCDNRMVRPPGHGLPRLLVGLDLGPVGSVAGLDVASRVGTARRLLRRQVDQGFPRRPTHSGRPGQADR
jgi:His/Glu/Gln/Arg/opine family amino acid ABC transporter permease subunit